MKHQSGSSPARPEPKRVRNSSKGATIIKCGYCDNIFSAVPRQAVCLKCKRPANKPLFWPFILLCLAFFPGGLLAAALLRRSQPYASSQALLFSSVGAAIWAALYLLVLPH